MTQIILYFSGGLLLVQECFEACHKGGTGRHAEGTNSGRAAG